MTRTWNAFFLAGGLVAIFCGQAFGQANAVESAKKIMKDQQDSIVWVSSVGKIVGTKAGVEVGKQEVKTETSGTIVDKSGLVVVSNSEIDISTRINKTDPQIQLTYDISDVKIRLPDGTELPANIVMKDPDLDLAFIMPDVNDETVKKTKFSSVDLSNAGKAEILDDIIFLTRLNRNMSDAPTVSLMRVASIVTKPRKYYVLSEAISGGYPAFTTDGKILGIAVNRKAGNVMTILPASEVLAVAKQALEKKPETPAASKPAAEKKEPAK